MGKKYLEVTFRGKILRIDANDFKAIYFYKKRKIPNVPSYFSKNTKQTNSSLTDTSNSQCSMYKND